MYEPMSLYFKPGLIHFMAYPETIKGEGPVLETIRSIACDDYFQAIEISWIKDPEVRKKAKAVLDTSHMTVSYGAQPRLLTTGLNINDLDENGRQRALVTLKEGIDEAYEMGAKGFAFLSGNYEEETKEESYLALVRSTKELCDHAKAKGDIKVILEIFDYDIDKKSLIGPAKLARRFAEDICSEHDNFGLMVDSSHIPMLYETYEEAIKEVKDYLVHAHMGNTVIKDTSAEAYGDMHPRFGFPNSENDVNELRDYLRALLDVGYLNKENPPVLSFEVKPWKDEVPEVVIANAKRTLNLAWAMV